MWITRFRAKLLSPHYPDVDLRFVSVNVFLGPNNSGKSRLLDLLSKLALRDVINTSGLQGPPHESPSIDQLANEVTLEQGDHLARPKTGLLPFRYLQVDRTPPPALDTRMTANQREQAQQSGTGVTDILAELFEMPRLRPVLQAEIERLFGVSCAFETRGFNLNWYADDGSPFAERTLNQQGRGIQYYVALFFYLYHPDVRVLLVDEPENSLHPQLQRALIARIRAITQEQGKQVFLATHSPILALPRTAEDLNGLFLLQRYRKPEPRILPLSTLVPGDVADRRRFESFLPNLDPGIAELFFARGALLVEGQTERQFLRYIAGRTARTADEFGVAIVESNGLGLMPGLIRLARSPLRHWRAVADGDLLTQGGQPYEGFRKELADTLDVAAPRAGLGSPEFATAQESLRHKGLYVLAKLGLEEYYISPAAQAYRQAHGTVSSPDKGWLLAQEIAFLADKDATFINASYAELLAPLDAVLRDIQASGFAPRATSELVGDILYADGEAIHRRVYREKWTEDRLRVHLSGSRSLSGYELHFEDAAHYELRWTDELAGQYRIRCDGVWFNVEFAANAGNPYATIRRGTVASE